MANILKINNDYSYFISNEEKVKRNLWSKMRFRERNYFHNRRYKMKLWDGFADFFKIETGKFLTGLLPEVKAALRHWNVKYELQDEREKINFLYEQIDKDFFNQFLPEGKNKIELFDYQVEYINSVIKNRRGIVSSPTGSGKTFSMLGTVKVLPVATPILILQNRISLAKQNYDELMDWKVPHVGGLWGGHFKPNIITVASIQSIDKIEKLLPKFKVLLVDEIHDMLSSKPKMAYRKLKNASIRVAFSATPFKFGETDPVQKYNVKGFFGPILKIKSTESGILTTGDLQERGILSPSICTFYPINEPSIPYDIYIDAITRGIAENNYFHKIVVRLAKKQKGRTLILVDRTAHGDILHKKIKGSLWVRGEDDMDTRKEAILQLQQKEHVIVIATQQIFNTGINVRTHNLINAASGQADHQIIQRMGRGLRLADDKEVLNYYDFVFNINDYLLDHSKKRIKILQQEGHQVIIKDEIDF